MKYHHKIDEVMIIQFWDAFKTACVFFSQFTSSFKIKSNFRVLATKLQVYRGIYRIVLEKNRKLNFV